MHVPVGEIHREDDLMQVPVGHIHREDDLPIYMQVPVGHIHREDDLLAGQADRLAGDAAGITLTNHC